MLILVIIFELAYAILPGEALLFQVVLSFSLIVGVLITSFTYGLWPGLLAASLANVYLLYALSGPGRPYVPLESMLRGEWLLFIIFYIPALVIGYLRDRIELLLLNERQAKEQAQQERLQLTAALEQMPVGVAIAKAPDGEIIFANQHLDSLVGRSVPRHQRFEDYPQNVLIDPETKQPLPPERWPLSRIIHGQETLVNEEYSFQHGDAITVLQVKGVPVYSQDQKVTSGVVIVDDITEEKGVEQRKDDFLSMISHELKTPVTSLKIFTQLAIKQLQKSGQKDLVESLKRIDTQADKLNRLISDMLHVAKAQSGRLEYRYDSCNLTSLIQDAVDEIRLTNPPQDLVLQAPKRPLTVKADPDRIQQVLFNLLSNAVKYSPSYGTVTIKAKQDQENVLVSIKDEGIGIPKREQSNIFNRFYQVSAKNDQSSPGLGIGLFICSEIIRNHGGEIWVESARGQGSTFSFSLPAPS